MTTYERLIEQRMELYSEAFDVLRDDERIAQTDVGPRTFDELRYPYGEVIPEETTHQQGNKFRHILRTNIYFERRQSDDYLDMVGVLLDIVPAVLEAFAGVECTVNFVPERIEDFAGEAADNTLLIMISVRWVVDTLVDRAA